MPPQSPALSTSKRKTGRDSFHVPFGRSREIRRQFKPKLFCDCDHPILPPKGRPRCAPQTQVVQLRFALRSGHEFNPVLGASHWPVIEKIRCIPFSRVGGARVRILQIGYLWKSSQLRILQRNRFHLPARLVGIMRNVSAVLPVQNESQHAGSRPRRFD